MESLEPIIPDLLEPHILVGEPGDLLEPHILSGEPGAYHPKIYLNMAKTRKAQSQSKADKKKTSDGALQKSFQASSGRTRVSAKSPPSSAAKAHGADRSGLDVSDVSKGDQSCFLTYLKCAMGAVDNEVKNKAERVMCQYKQLTAPAKKQMVANFLKSGGKRQGLSSIYSQVVTHVDEAREGEWAGYVTPTALMGLYSVSP